MYPRLAGTGPGVSIDVLIREGEDAMQEKLRASTRLGVGPERIGVEIMRQRSDTELLVIYVLLETDRHWSARSMDTLHTSIQELCYCDTNVRRSLC